MCIFVRVFSEDISYGIVLVRIYVFMFLFEGSLVGCLLSGGCFLVFRGFYGL